MAFGFEVRRPDGTLNVSSDSVPGAIRDQFAIGAQSSGSLAFPDLAGFTVEALAVGATLIDASVTGTFMPVITVGYSGATPIVYWQGDAFTQAATIFVFAR